MKTIVYDIEIKKAIEDKKSPRLDGIEYCAGWGDHAGMGISSVAVYEYVTDRYRVFMSDNISEFQHLVDDADLIVGFNSIPFDNAVCRANGINVPDEKSYDLLREIWAAAGLGPRFTYPSHMGFSLDAVAAVNLGANKSGNGALAPVQFQRGQYGSLIDYNLTDVWLTKRLYDRARVLGFLRDPRRPNEVLPFRSAQAQAA